MAEFEGISDKRFNRYVSKNTDAKGYPPDNYRVSLKIPMDTAVSLLKRYEAEPLKWAQGKHVTLEEIICQLLYIWGKKLPTEKDQLKDNIFDPYFPGQVTKPRSWKKKTLKVKGTEEKRGRKPRKHLTNLFEGSDMGSTTPQEEPSP